MIRLPPLPAGLMDAELERMLATALEYEGWQEAETLYSQVHPALAGSAPELRARALMDHARVLRQLDKPGPAAAREAEAEAVLGQPIQREEAPKSSVDELKEREAKSRGFFGRFFGK
jgi:hypothetical protein